MPQRITKKLVAGAVCAVVGVALALLPLGTALRFMGYDLLSVFTPGASVTNCVIIEMDQKSYRELGQTWGQRWDRELHVRLLDKLTKDGAKLVVFDVTFLDATTDDADRKLAEAMRANGKVVLAAVLEPITGQGVAGNEVQQPLPLLANSAVGWGLAEVTRDTDLTVRRHFSGTENHASLAWVAANALSAPVTRLAEQRNVPRWIHYGGPPRTISHLSYSDALNAPAGRFRDQLVFIGGKPKTLFLGDDVDEFATPFTRWDGNSSGGVEIMATTTLNLIQGDWIDRCPIWLELLLVMFAGGVTGFVLLRARPLKAILISACVGLTVLVLAIGLMWFARTWFVWTVVVLAQVPLALLISLSARKTAPVEGEAEDLAPERSNQPLTSPSPSMPMSSVTSESVVAVGAVVADYKLLRMIGEGGYGQVWLCRNTVGIYRAVKVVFRRNFDDERPYKREFRGVENFMRLNHPRLLQVFHIGPNAPTDLFYYVMQLGDDEKGGQKFDPSQYEARTLARDLERLGQLPVAECVELGLSIVDGLEYLHSQNLIHRDIKPSNIIYVNGQAKLADLGLVADPETTDLTMVGTRYYMDPFCPSTVAGDLFSLAKVLYVAATGLRPERFPELPPATAAPPESRMGGLLRILIKACTPNIQERYTSISQMRADLESLRGLIDSQGRQV